MVKPNWPYAMQGDGSWCRWVNSWEPGGAGTDIRKQRSSYMAELEEQCQKILELGGQDFTQ
jgi:hypothetical protein